MRRAHLVAIAVGMGIACVGARAAWARRGVRPFFEPTDLELESAGVIEADLQAGPIRGQEGPWRLVVPDFEVDVGLTRRIELDIDGAYALEAPSSGSWRFSNSAPDNLWVGLKIGAVDWADDDTPGDLDAWALGFQSGPKLPVAPGSRGVGIETVALIAHLMGRSHFVLNLGAFVDPAPASDMTRPIGFEGGLDFDRDLDKAGHYQVLAEVSGVRFVSSDPHQLFTTAGLGWSPTEATQVTLTGMWGFLEGDDKYGVLLGISQKLRLWGRK